MTDYKEKYQKAVKALDEVEQESFESVQGLYKALFSILNELKGRHSEIDKAITALPKRLTGNSTPPVEELERIKDLIVSYFGNADDAGAAPSVLDALLSTLDVSDGLQEGIAELQKDLTQAQSSKDFVKLAKKIANVVLKSTSSTAENSSGTYSIEAINKGLLLQLEKWGESDSELAKSIDVATLLQSLESVNNLQSLEHFYKEVFEALGQHLSKKDEFIVELSRLIETVVHQLADISTDLNKESVKSSEERRSRARLTSLVGSQVNALKDSVHQSDSLNILKTLLSEQLGELNQTVSNLAALESEKAQEEAEGRVKMIMSKLSVVESEVSDLKASLHKANEQAFVDSLTGVPNRRAYDERIKLEFKRWQRKKEPLVLAVLDVDHFKSINDTYGHPIGDKVLRTISQLVDKKVRDSDFFGRIGGEEFAVIFTGVDLDIALKRLDQFRESIENCKFGSKGKRILITMSIGCALFHEDDKPEDVYRRADKALYKAKSSGRNKCLSERDI